MRGVRHSGGASTLGTLETQDLISVVDYLVSRPDVDRDRIGALGFSLGGAVSLAAASRDRRIKAVVDDSGLADIRDWLSPGLWGALRHPGDPLSYASIQFSRLRLGVNIMSFRPVTEIARISPRPVLIIQGTADTVVPIWEGRKNFAAAREPKSFWLVGGARHGEALQRAGAQYTLRVINFFHQAFRRTEVAHD
jgi:fermentation-respiration switch protein FrsA (DUF1100 family)